MMKNQMNDPAVTNREDISEIEGTFCDDNLRELLDARAAMEEMGELSRRVGVFAIKTRYEMSKKRRKEPESAPERKRRKVLHDGGNFNPTLEGILSIETSDKEHLVRMMRAYKNMQAMYQTFMQELNVMVEECECDEKSQNGLQTETERSNGVQEQLNPTE